MALETGNWQYFDGEELVFSGVSERTARDTVIINANPAFWAKDSETGNTIRWSDVCSEPWPNRPDDPDNIMNDPNYPYGAPPEGWPYGNGC